MNHINRQHSIKPSDYQENNIFVHTRGIITPWKFHTLKLSARQIWCVGVVYQLYPWKCVILVCFLSLITLARGVLFEHLWKFIKIAPLCEKWNHHEKNGHYIHDTTKHIYTIGIFVFPAVHPIIIVPKHFYITLLLLWQLL